MPVPTHPALLSTPLGTGRLYARPGDSRLWLLDAPATVLWDLHARGLNAKQLAELVAERFGLAAATIRGSIDSQLQQWRESGLLGLSLEAMPVAMDDPFVAVPTPQPLSGGAWRVRAADRDIGFKVDDPALRQGLAPWLLPAEPDNRADPVDHRLWLSGVSSEWQLSRDGQPVASGETLDEALLAILAALTGLACRPAERLLILHGAGLVTPDGRGLLLAAPGGSGKTTLAAALNADGWPLLHDDVVPIALDGCLIGLGLPIALKAGSWALLARRRPEVASWPVTQRYDQPVRLLPPLGKTPLVPVPPKVLLFPRYRPDAPLHRERLTPEQALQGLLVAETVIHGVTQAKLEWLARWVESLPAWSLTYSDLDQSLAGVHAILAETPGT